MGKLGGEVKTVQHFRLNQTLISEPRLNHRQFYDTYAVQAESCFLSRDILYLTLGSSAHQLIGFAVAELD